MRPPARWLGAGVVAAVVLGGALFIRRPARGLSCETVSVEMELESLTEGGAPASTEAYLDHEVQIFGESGAVLLVARHGPPPMSHYEETYRAPPAGR
jgi:hypothetical protein